MNWEALYLNKSSEGVHVRLSPTKEKTPWEM